MSGIMNVFLPPRPDTCAGREGSPILSACTPDAGQVMRSAQKEASCAKIRSASCRLGAVVIAATLPASAEWRATEVEKPYAVSGSTGIDLYRAVGSSGPLLGSGTRTIAVTTFDLKWRRDYQPQSDGSCRLVSALPFLTITYMLPKPWVDFRHRSIELENVHSPGSARTNWSTAASSAR